MIGSGNLQGQTEQKEKFYEEDGKNMGSTYYSTQSCHANECVGRHEDHQHLIEDRFVH